MKKTTNPWNNSSPDSQVNKLLNGDTIVHKIKSLGEVCEDYCSNILWFVSLLEHNIRKIQQIVGSGNTLYITKLINIYRVLHVLNHPLSK